MWSRDAFEDLLKTLATTPSGGRIHIVAHSMGTLLTLETLRMLRVEAGEAAVARIDQSDALSLSCPFAGEVERQRRFADAAFLVEEGHDHRRPPARGSIDLSEVRPTVAFPHLPGNAKTIDEIEAMEPIKIDQVVIGSCTNGRMEDMRKAAAVLKGRTVHPDVRVMVIPATQKIYKQCIKEGLLDIFVDAGCAVNTPSCGPCMGGHMGVMAAGERCVSTTNRNFVGRMGHVDSLIYLASPEVAAASAIAGYIANPERAGEEA